MFVCVLFDLCLSVASFFVCVCCLTVGVLSALCFVFCRCFVFVD